MNRLETTYVEHPSGLAYWRLKVRIDQTWSFEEPFTVEDRFTPMPDSTSANYRRASQALSRANNQAVTSGCLRRLARAYAYQHRSTG